MRKILTVLLLTILAIGALAYSQSSERNSKKYASKVSTNNLLAISWQNAFCETHQNRRECRNINPKGYAASNFTLHGLWPQPRNRVNCKGDKKVWLEKSLYNDLLKVMPAAKSGLHKHEWKKHGTCYGKPADLYFEDSIALIKQVNNSSVRDLFAKNIGKSLTKKEVMQAFDKSFGKGSGRKVKMMCRKGLITELQINLKGEVTTQSDMATLLKGASNAQGGCRKGKVDRVGFSKR
ncbi:MAG: ribonuclease T2 [Epsilonproteobacteria bacterium]|nr:ribonuclease T2 [Campylobacterota bacterium]